MITKRPRRLDHFSYLGYQRYFVTTCAAFKRPLFADGPFAAGLIEQLLQNAARFQFAVVAYCVMPDHLHVLEATADGADLVAFVKRFKQVTGYAYRRRSSDPLWQPGYHERTLRNDEATDDVVRYILENPIRAGLAAKFGEYPYAGSGVYVMRDLADAWEEQT